jgi:methylated-DNA-[protein]-cysteine S-methyltransferase
MQNRYFWIFRTGGGWIGLLASDHGFTRVTLPQTSREAAAKELGDEINNCQLDEIRFAGIVPGLKTYFMGSPIDFPQKLDYVDATSFQVQVWEKTRSIPYGQTRSYSWIAEQINRPRACRAVGQALGKNPLPIIVPCHRVVAADGSLHGFRGGLAMKQRLLLLEQQRR